MSQLDTSNSSWIRSLRYVPLADEYKQQGATGGLLEVSTVEGSRYVYLVPSWVPGLLCASKSRGRAFSRLVKGRYPSTRLDN